jgi:hypothetical protein
LPKVTLDFVIDGDILENDVLVNEVYLFGAGTVLTKHRIEILKELGVKSVEIENRKNKYSSIDEVFDNLDERFSYVKNNPFMQRIKSWVKEIIIEKESFNETSN